MSARAVKIILDGTFLKLLIIQPDKFKMPGTGFHVLMCGYVSSVVYGKTLLWLACSVVYNNKKKPTEKLIYVDA